MECYGWRLRPRPPLARRRSMRLGAGSHISGFAGVESRVGDVPLMRRPKVPRPPRSMQPTAETKSPKQRRSISPQKVGKKSKEL